MPQIFKALATIAAWILFVLGCLGFVMALVSTAVSGEAFFAPSVGTLVGVGYSIASLVLSVCVMKLRQMLE
jgi:hypothetical protein